MADQTITCTDDAYLDEGASTTNRTGIDHLNYRAGGAQSNPVFRFDVSSLAGKVWDSVVLRLTYFDDSGDPAPGSTIYLSYINQPIVFLSGMNDPPTWNIYGAGLNWNAAGAENAIDNNQLTRVPWPLSGSHVVDDIVTSPDLTDPVQQAIDSGGILNLILYGSGTNSAVQQFDSLETVAGAAAQLFVSNVTTAAIAAGGGQYRRGATNPVMAPVDSATVIKKGDLLHYDADDVKPASSITYGASLILTQELFHDQFLGVAMQGSRAGDTRDIRVATSGVFEFMSASAVFQIGDRIGADDNAGATALLNQTVIGVARTAPQAAIGRVAKQVGSADIKVDVMIKSTERADGPQDEA